ncbi:MAG: DsbA family protein [Candidatus Methylomirabilales bacterium]
MGRGRSGRRPGAVLGVALLAGLMAAPAAARGGERELSRADVVTTLERGPGPSRGFPSAPITVVELSDFQCTYCRKFRWETLPALEQEYIQSGRVRLVYRHLAVLGQASVRAAEAASCAHDQQRFWEYHDKLFEQKGALAFSLSRLQGYAAELGLDGKAFGACLDGRKHAQRVEAETILGQALGATGTPAFLIKGQLLMGAHPIETFRRVLEGMVK